MLLKLAGGDIAETVSQDLLQCLVLLHTDPGLGNGRQLGETVEQLLLTASELALRFRQYQMYPFRLVLCSSRLNPCGHSLEIEKFLEASEDALDVGYGLPLHREAWVNGSKSQAVLYMQSAGVQSEIETWATHVGASTLDVERAHQQVKRSEKRLCLRLDTGNRDLILRRYRTSRNPKALQKHRQFCRATQGKVHEYLGIGVERFAC